MLMATLGLRYEVVVTRNFHYSKATIRDSLIPSACA